MVKISVIIPVYNAQDYLEECVRSVLRQTLEELEVICVDDGSTDNSLYILKQLQEKDQRIWVYCQENHGAGEARNLALKKAVGQFVSFLDADDFLMDERALEELYCAAVRENVKICGGQFYIKKKRVLFIIIFMESYTVLEQVENS